MEHNLISGNLVEEYKLGNTKIEIYDSAYVGKSKEDINKILEAIADIFIRSYERKEVQ